MKQHTAEFKQELIKMGKQIDSVITYTLNGETITLHDELYAVTPLFEANILKSVMKQLEVESSVAIPYGTIINYKLGVLVGEEYEYLDYGNYVVFSNEKQEDTNTYKITCYDKMLYSMKPYEEITGTYPMTIKQYLGAVATKIGLTLKDTSFYNNALTLQTDIYKGLEYTYRDVLDEIAEATGSIIIINADDQIEVIYPTDTGDTINEDYFKDVNVNFSQKYGPINSIVLSRAGESDNVYIQDDESIAQNGLCEVKIVDNQIMNFNDRSDYLEGLLNALDGVEYYINDFETVGLLYYDIGDYYNVQIGENTYKCLMLNSEINVTSGLKETIYTDLPEQSETDYTKADKTDQKINQTYIIVDKQNQRIDSVVNNVTEQNNKISQITQTVDEINSKISDIADITTYGESSYASVSLTDVNESEPIMLKIHPTIKNISYLYPHTTLYPSPTLYMPTRIVRFIRTYEEEGETLTENIDYVLPDNLLVYDDTTYDEFYLDYESQTCQVTKRCKYNADGTVSVLENEVVTDYEYPTILLGDGDYTIQLLGYEYGYIFTRLMTKNIYTTQFYTKAETNSLIEQTSSSIDLSVNQKLTNYSTTNQMNSAINVKANEITSSVSNTYATKSQLNNYSTTTQMNSAINQKADSITSSVSATYETKSNANNTYATKTQLNTAKSEIKQTTDSISSTVSTKVGNNEVISKINQSSESVTINANKLSLAGKTINLTSDNTVIKSTNFNVDKNGNMSCSNASVSGTISSSNATITGGNITLNGNSGFRLIRVQRNNSNSTMTYITPDMVGINNNGSTVELGAQSPFLDLTVEGVSMTHVGYEGITTPRVTQTSLESDKKNFEKFENALDILKNIDIYKYNLKDEDKDTKKHIGFVIGDKFKYSKEVTSNENNGVDLYSFVSLCCQAIKEQQEIIEQMKKEIEELKGGNTNG